MRTSLLLILIGTVSLSAQSPPPARQLTIAEYASAATLHVSSAAFAQNAAIPRPYSAYGENFSPAIAWQGAPAATKTFVVLTEDPDAKAPAPTPFVHWTVFDLPANYVALHESIPSTPRLPHLDNAQQGKTSRGTVGYFGPRPPLGEPAHHYHFEVFALDARLDLPPGAAVDQITAAMRGHVLAAGEIVGTFAP
jgi:Raf kinase inhibitor-like YbhB/YbcL family protein